MRGKAKGFWAAKVLSVSAKAAALIWHRHFNLKKVVHELKRAADEVPRQTLQGPPCRCGCSTETSCALRIFLTKALCTGGTDGCREGV